MYQIAICSPKDGHWVRDQFILGISLTIFSQLPFEKKKKNPIPAYHFLTVLVMHIGAKT